MLSNGQLLQRFDLEEEYSYNEHEKHEEKEKKVAKRWLQVVSGLYRTPYKAISLIT